DPAFEKRRHRHAGGINAGAVFHFDQQPSAFDLRLALGAGKGVPAALALAGLWIAHVDDDGPMTGRAFADVASHFEGFLLLSVFGCLLVSSGGPAAARFLRMEKRSDCLISESI